MKKEDVKEIMEMHLQKQAHREAQRAVVDQTLMFLIKKMGGKVAFPCDDYEYHYKGGVFITVDEKARMMVITLATDEEAIAMSELDYHDKH